MKTERIDKRQHPQVRFLKSVRKGDEGLLFIEGLRLIDEALRSGLTFKTIYATDAIASDGAFKNAVTASGRKPVAVVTLTNDVMGYVSDVESPPGVIGVAEKPQKNITAENLAAPDGLWAVLHGIQIPSNTGAILRAAEAAGVSGLFATKGGAAPFGPKALRAASGSAFRLPISEEPSWDALKQKLADAGVQPVVADAKADLAYTDWNWKQKTALVLGPETRRPGAEIGDDVPRVKIPMAEGVESLNVAVAAGILLFEARRQRTLR